MKGAHDIKMASCWVSVKRDEDNIPQRGRYERKPSVGIASNDGFAVDKNSVFDDDKGIAKGVAIIVIHILQVVFRDHGGVKDHLSNFRQLIILKYCRVPLRKRREAGQYSSIHKGVDEIGGWSLRRQRSGWGCIVAFSILIADM